MFTHHSSCNICIFNVTDMIEIDSDKKVTFESQATKSDGDPGSDPTTTSRPRSVQEWLEQNDTRNNASRQIAVRLYKF